MDASPIFKYSIPSTPAAKKCYPRYATVSGAWWQATRRKKGPPH